MFCSSLCGSILRVRALPDQSPPLTCCTQTLSFSHFGQNPVVGLFIPLLWWEQALGFYGCTTHGYLSDNAYFHFEV